MGRAWSLVLACVLLPACSGDDDDDPPPPPPPGQATSVTFLTPLNNSPVRINRPIRATVSLGAPGGATGVDFFVDSVTLGPPVTTPPWTTTFTWAAFTTPVVGLHTLSATATWPDNSTASAQVGLSVQNGPFSSATSDHIVYAADDMDAAGFPRGLAVADVTGDGIPDLIWGAPFADGLGNGGVDRGDVYVVSGGTGMAAAIDLGTTAPAASMHGAAASEWFGYQVTTGDINGDGTADVIVGAPGAGGPAGGRAGCGRVYVFFGGTGLSGAINPATTAAGLTIYGVDAGDNLGWTVAVGDVNGDSVDDVVMGAPQGDGPTPPGTRTGAGEVHVVFGNSTALPAAIDLNSATPGYTIYGADANDNYGEGLAVAEVTGDTIADILVGSRRGDGPTNSGNDEGEVAVIAGATGLTGSFDLNSTAPAARIYGDDANDQLGLHIAVADVDGIAGPELIIGAFLGDGPGNAGSDRGEVVILPGGSSLAAVTDLATTAPTTIIYGQRDNDFLGFGLAAGDIDADGDADLFIGQNGSEGPSGTSTGCGEAVVWFSPGSTLPTSVDFSSTAPGLVFYGADTGDRLGYAVHLGDLDGDGFLDLLATADTADGPANAGTDRGEVIVIRR